MEVKSQICNNEFPGCQRTCQGTPCIWVACTPPLGAWRGTREAASVQQPNLESSDKFQANPCNLFLIGTVGVCYQYSKTKLNSNSHIANIYAEYECKPLS